MRKVLILVVPLAEMVVVAEEHAQAEMAVDSLEIVETVGVRAVVAEIVVMEIGSLAAEAKVGEIVAADGDLAVEIPIDLSVSVTLAVLSIILKDKPGPLILV